MSSLNEYIFTSKGGMSMESINVSNAQLMKELEAIIDESRKIRVDHCTNHFLAWRECGYSPNAIRIRYGLGADDMYKKVIGTIVQRTGLDRDELLAFPGRGRGEHTITKSQSPKTKENLGEAQELIRVYSEMLEQISILQQTIKETLGGN